MNNRTYRMTEQTLFACQPARMSGQAVAIYGIVFVLMVALNLFN